jgi:hypothetical protein
MLVSANRRIRSCATYAQHRSRAGSAQQRGTCGFHCRQAITNRCLKSRVHSESERPQLRTGFSIRAKVTVEAMVDATDTWLPSIVELVGKEPQISLAENAPPVVYSKAYNISFGGLERLHPFDASKFAKVLQHLRKVKLIDNVRSRASPDMTWDRRAWEAAVPSHSTTTSFTVKETICSDSIRAMSAL